MNTALSIREITADAPLPPDVTSTVPSALRSDLKISHQLFEGRAYAIIKDPLSLKYFRLPAEDYALAALFDGRRDVSAIRAAFLRQQPQAALNQTRDEITERILRFANELMLGGFLEATGAGVRQQQKLENLRQPVITPWSLFMKMLFLKIPLFDPDPLLIRMERRMRWIWSWAGFALSMVIFLAGLVVFVLNWPRISPSLNDFLTLPNLALVWALTILVKVVHEFGHGLTCKHYGGEVHEMGFMAMVFSPFLYADVTDSYLFPNKRHRMLVAAAGIYIELVIAAIATLLWAVSQPGTTQQLLFNLMLITSVWTILFNANPLMKFDGYYILTDLLDVPNLRAKAQMCVSEMFRRFLFGKNEGAPANAALLPRRRRGWFVFYSIAAQLYLLQITLGIAMIFHHMLKPYGLAWLGDWLGIGALFSMLIAPVAAFFKKQTASTHTTTLKGRRRPWLVLSGLLVTTALVLQIPWPVRIERPAVLQPVNAAFVRAEVAGRLERIEVKTGQQVKKDDVVATLSSTQISSKLRATEIQVERAKRELDLTIGAAEPAAYKQSQALLAQAEAALQEARRLETRLTLRAPQDGVVLTPDLERLASGSLRPGDALCEIADLDPIHIYIPLGEHQARHIRAGQKVELRVPALPGRTIEGSVLEDSKTPPARELPPNLVATLGGDLAAQPDAQGHLKPIETTFGVLVSLPNADGFLRPGMTGTARLHGDEQPLWRCLWMKLLDFISLDYRL